MGSFPLPRLSTLKNSREGGCVSLIVLSHLALHPASRARVVKWSGISSRVSFSFQKHRARS